MTQLEQISLGVARTRLGGVTVVSDAPIRARRLSSGHVDRQPFGRIVSEMIRAIKIVGDEKVPRNTPRTSLLPFTMYTHLFHRFFASYYPSDMPLNVFHRGTAAVRKSMWVYHHEKNDIQEKHLSCINYTFDEKLYTNLYFKKNLKTRLLIFF